MGLFVFLSIMFLIPGCFHANYVEDVSRIPRSDCNRIVLKVENVSTVLSYPVTKAYPVGNCQNSKTLNDCKKEISRVLWKHKLNIRHMKVPNYIRKCCAGFEIIFEKCMPICEDYCVHGDCVNPGVCVCHEGWEGKQCTKEWDKKRHRKNCNEDYKCQNSGICNKADGLCLCPPGFDGLFCESPCGEYSFDDRCHNICRCKNGGTCEYYQSKCLCPPGYVGQFCEKTCPDFTYGIDCNNSCTCEMNNTKFCNYIDGFCKCHSGYIGNDCQKKCRSNKWGPGCENHCKCGINSSCNHISGVCDCLPGFNGTHCNETDYDLNEPLKHNFMLAVEIFVVLSLLITFFIYCGYRMCQFSSCKALLLFEPRRRNSSVEDVSSELNGTVYPNAAFSDTTETVDISSVFPSIMSSSLVSDVADGNEQRTATNNYGYIPMFETNNAAAMNPREYVGVRYSRANRESFDTSLYQDLSMEDGLTPEDENIYVELI